MRNFLQRWFRYLFFNERGEVQGRWVGTPGVQIATVSVTAPSALAANTTGDVVVSIPQLKVGDVVIAQAPLALEAGLELRSTGSPVSVAGQVTVRIGNQLDVAGPVTAAQNWTFIIFRQS